MRELMRTVAVALCCSALAGLLAGCGSAAAATPTPTVDPVTQAYLSVLHTYYVPFAAAESENYRRCLEGFTVATTTQRPKVMAQCRPVEIAASDAGQAVLTNLGTVVPPPRWQRANGELTQGIQALIAYHNASVHAIDADSVAQFEVAAHLSDPAFSLFCDPIAQLNEGPPKLSPTLLAPNTVPCQSTDA